jgi:hypothetical protein
VSVAIDSEMSTRMFVSAISNGLSHVERDLRRADTEAP